MRNLGGTAATLIGTGLILLTTACGGGSSTPPPPTTYVLTVDSATPSSGATITATPADNNNKTSGVTPFTLSYNAGAAVTLTAPATAASNNFSAWSGCATANT